MSDAETPWLDRLRSGFRKTSERLGDNLTGLFTKSALDEETLDEIEEALIVSDLGPAMAGRVRERLAEGRYDRGIDEAVRLACAAAALSVSRLGAQGGMPSLRETEALASAVK